MWRRRRLCRLSCRFYRNRGSWRNLTFPVTQDNTRCWSSSRLYRWAWITMWIVGVNSLLTLVSRDVVIVSAICPYCICNQKSTKHKHTCQDRPAYKCFIFIIHIFSPPHHNRNHVIMVSVHKIPAITHFILPPPLGILIPCPRPSD